MKLTSTSVAPPQSIAMGAPASRAAAKAARIASAFAKVREPSKRKMRFALIRAPRGISLTFSPFGRRTAPVEVGFTTTLPLFLASAGVQNINWRLSTTEAAWGSSDVGGAPRCDSDHRRGARTLAIFSRDIVHDGEINANTGGVAQAVAMLSKNGGGRKRSAFEAKAQTACARSGRACEG